jgi:uncharacterized membrane protein
MELLIIGVFLWSAVHYLPGFEPNFRNKLVEKLGNGYRGLFSILIALSIFFIIRGWNAADPEIIYDAPDWGRSITALLMVISIFLLGSANGPANIKRYIRHPMLTGVIVWGVAHLISNGDNRSVVLFGGMVIWAVAEIIIINKRDGEWQKPPVSPIAKDIIKLVAALILYGVLFYGHQYFTGMPVM